MNNDINWTREISVHRVSKSDRDALERAKRKEQKQKKKGWRWYKVNDKLRVLVPYDKKGEITQQGKEIIERQLKMLNAY